jgi:TonB family protein
MISLRRPLALAFAVLIHVCLILALLRNADAPAKAGKGAIIFLIPIAASVASPPPPELSIQFETPTTITAVAPDIVIGESVPSNAQSSNGKRYDLHLPPRLDPQTPNVAPALPAGARFVAGNAYIVIVRALVLDNGRVGEAEIGASSGFPELDALAIAQVREHWRFLPGTLNGKAVSDWLSVEVLFKAA